MSSSLKTEVMKIKSNEPAMMMHWVSKIILGENCTSAHGNLHIVIRVVRTCPLRMLIFHWGCLLHFRHLRLIILSCCLYTALYWAYKTTRRFLLEQVVCGPILGIQDNQKIPPIIVSVWTYILGIQDNQKIPPIIVRTSSVWTYIGHTRQPEDSSNNS